MQVSILGADGNQLCQIPQLRAAFAEMGHSHSFDPNHPDNSFVFIGNPPFHNYLTLPENKKTIFNVLDLCPHCKEHDDIIKQAKAHLPLAHKVTTISKTIAKEIEDSCGVKAETIYYPMKPVRHTGVKKYPNFKAMILGRIGDPNKRTMASISALVNAGFKESEVAVVGPEYLGFGMRLGMVNDETLNDLYNSVDYVMMMSKYEGIGLPAIEAATCGAIPIVAPDLSTFDEFWAQSPLGLHYQSVSSIADVAKLIGAIEKDHEWKSQIKEDLLAYSFLAFRPKFDGKNVAKRIIEVYHTI